MLQFVCTDKSYPRLGPVCEEERGKRKWVNEQHKKAASPRSGAWICPAACPELVISLYMLVCLSTWIHIPPVREKTYMKFTGQTFAEYGGAF